MLKSKSKTDGNEVEEAPRKRVPFGGHRPKLQLSKEDAKALRDDGWTARWINNKDGRLQQAMAGGYEHVLKKEAPSIGQFSMTGNKNMNGKVSLIVSKGEGQPLEAFLMKIRTEFYDEDQVAKEQANIDYDEALNRGQPGGNVVDGQYVPEGHVNKV